MRTAGRVRAIVGRILVLGLLWTCGLAANAGAQAYLDVETRGLTTNALITGDLYLGSFRPDQLELYRLPCYVRLDYPLDNPTAWGIQIYTDNRSGRTSWTTPSGIYGGLRNVNNPDLAMPMYWQVYGQLQDVAGTWGTPASVTLTAGGLAFTDQTLTYWGLIRDRSDQDISGLWTSPNVLANRTVVNRQGELAPYPRVGRTSLAPPVYLYLGVDMRTSSAAANYETLIYLDLYNLGVDLSTGGYATPNPFTPATGQRTNFNVFLRDVHSAYAIRIYTVRGRLIRTITDTTEWDGRTDSGQLVEGGLYLYQIEAEGKRASGTVVVIK